jgi:2-hydroxychromene-2-carboxylate isomerase
VRWHPVLLAAISEATGVKLTPFVPIKWSYAQKDLARSARKLGVPFTLPPAFPGLWLAPPRAMLWIRATHGDDTAQAFARACYAKAFGEGVDIGNVEVVLEEASKLGVDADALREGIGTPAIKAAFKDNIDAALTRGVFGVPFVVADEESFWGADRMHDLEEHLSGS